MPTWELLGYTDCRYQSDVRYRSYTRSERLARMFGQIPKIGFNDSGHGIVFVARENNGRPKRPEVRIVADWVNEQLRALAASTKPKRDNLRPTGRRLVAKRERWLVIDPCNTPVPRGKIYLDWEADMVRKHYNNKIKMMTGPEALEAYDKEQRPT